MNLQLINISLPDVFQRYSKKYNIYRDFYEAGVMALELREITPAAGEIIQNILHQKNEICFKSGATDELVSLIVFGTAEKFKELGREILSKGNEDLGYKISTLLRSYLEHDQLYYNISDHPIKNNVLSVMGILNVTPDSFSDGGKYYRKEEAVAHALEMIDAGADIIDIGGESTRPGSEAVSVQEETDRVIPVITEILKLKPEALLSIDTTKKEVADAALRQGVKIVNDISSASFDPEILNVVKQYDAAYVIMHMKGTPKTMQQSPSYEFVISEIYDYFTHKIQQVKKSGIKTIIIDPGIGFGKRIRDNYEIIRRLDEFKGLGLPIMIGLSRKSFLGKSMDLSIEERDSATIVAETMAAAKGAGIIRTHNVANTVQIKKFMKNYLNSEIEINNV